MIKRNKAMVFRIYPNYEQEVLLAKTFGSVRFIWNQMLSKALDNDDNSYPTPAKFKKDYEWLKEPDSLALANTQIDLKQAFSNYRKNPKHFKLPRYKSKKNSRNSYTTNNVNNNIILNDRTIKLPKLGSIKVKKHRSIPDNWLLKSVTVRKNPTGKYFVSILFEYEEKEITKDIVNVLGLDFSMPDLYVDSNGDKPDATKLKIFRKNQVKLAKEQKVLSRRYGQAKKDKKDLYNAKNYQKQKLKVAKIQEKIKNQRKDYLHKLSNEITNHCDAIIVEDLNMSGMAKALNFGKSVHDNSWGNFLLCLTYKLEESGGKLIKIAKSFPSTKMCSGCGNIKIMDLSDRVYECPSCNLVIDRDENAAINILNEGLRLLNN